MKKLDVWLNEEQYRRVVRKCRNKKLTVYAYLKSLVLKDLSD